MNKDTEVYIDYLDKLDGRGSSIKQKASLAVRRALTPEEGLIALRMVITNDWLNPTVRTNGGIVDVHELSYPDILDAFWKKWRRRDRSYFDRLRYTEGMIPERTTSSWNRSRYNPIFVMMVTHDNETHFNKMMRQHNVMGYRVEWRSWYQLLDAPRSVVFERFAEVCKQSAQIREGGLSSILVLDVANFYYHYRQARMVYHYEYIPS